MTCGSGQERMDAIADIFAQHDKDGSGTLSMSETKDMMMAALDGRVDVPKEGLAFCVCNL